MARVARARCGRLLGDTVQFAGRDRWALLGQGGASADQGSCVSARRGRPQFVCPPSFYSSDPVLLADFERVCSESFQGAKLGRFTQAREVVRVTVSRDRSDGYHTPSPLERWLRQLDLRWKLSDRRGVGGRKGPRSDEKFVPEV